MDPSQRIGSLMRITLADEPGVKQEQQRRPHVRREPHPARGMGEPGDRMQARSHSGAPAIAGAAGLDSPAAPVRDPHWTVFVNDLKAAMPEA